MQKIKKVKTQLANKLRQFGKVKLCVIREGDMEMHKLIYRKGKYEAHVWFNEYQGSTSYDILYSPDYNFKRLHLLEHSKGCIELHDCDDTTISNIAKCIVDRVDHFHSRDITNRKIVKGDEMSYLEKVKIELVTIFSQSGVAELQEIRLPNIGDVTRVSYRKGDYKISIILQPLDESNGVKTIIDAIWYYPKNDTPQMLEYIHREGELYDYQDDVISVVANSMMERIDYLYNNRITKIPHYKDVSDVLKQKDDIVGKLLKQAIDGEIEINKLTKNQIKLTKRANKSTKLRKAEIDKLAKSIDISSEEHIALYDQLQAEFNKNKKLAKKLKRLDRKKARKIWSVLLSYMKDERYASDKLTIWSICNDLIMKFPELEGEEDLQKEFVELYNNK